MQKKIISSDNAPAAIGPYSQAVEAGGLVFFSGQIPLQADGTLVAGGIEEQATQVMNNMQAMLDAAGLDFSNVVKTTIYLTSLEDFATVNGIYGRYFNESPPARACVEVSALPKGSAVEIEWIASR